MDLYNNLLAMDIQLLAFMFGTRELKELKSSLKQCGKDQIVGRFMINEIQYTGIRSEKELSFCLASMDKLHAVAGGYENLEETLLDFYFPHADGRRFYDLADDYFNAFITVRDRHGIRAGDIPMKYFIDSFVICINMYGCYGDMPVCFPGREELVNCIELTGYGESDDEYDRSR